MISRTAAFGNIVQLNALCLGMQPAGFSIDFLGFRHGLNSIRLQLGVL